MTLDLTRRETTAWIDQQIHLIEQGDDAAHRCRTAAIELAAIERHGLARRLPNMVRALRILIARLEQR